MKLKLAAAAMKAQEERNDTFKLNARIQLFQNGSPGVDQTDIEEFYNLLPAEKFEIMRDRDSKMCEVTAKDT